jgi:beta-lactamase regulating signal transducer with metallopeptidase domain
MTSILQLAASNVLFAALLALLALAVSRLWKNQHVSHLMWVIVLAKLVTPPLWNVHVPVLAAIHSASTSVTEDDGLRQQGESADQITLESNALSYPEEAVDDLSTGATQDGFFPPTATDELVERDASALEGEPHALIPAGTPRVGGWPTVLAALWAASSAFCAILVIVRVFRFHRLARRGEPADGRLVQRVGRLGKRLGLRRIPDVRVLEAEVSPMVWLLARRQMLLLPKRLVAELTPAQLDTVIAHELAHLARRDDLVRLLETVVSCLFWWNPIVWFARRELHAAEEDCCDALVVCLLPESRRQYGEALLRAAEMVTFGRSLPALASAFGQKRVLKRRIEMILKHKFQRSASWQARLALLILALAVLPLAATAMSQQSPTRDVGNPSDEVNNAPEVIIDLLGAGGSDAASLGLDPADVVRDVNGIVTGSESSGKNEDIAQAGISPSNPVPADVFPAQAVPFNSAQVDRTESPERVRNARETAEAFLAAGMSGDVRAAMRFTGPRPIQENDVKKLAAGFKEPEKLAAGFKTPQAGSELIDVVHSQERGDRGNAIAITNSFLLSEPRRDGRDAGRLVLQLFRIKGRWFVSDIDLATEESAKKDLKDFLEKFPGAQQVWSKDVALSLNRLVPPEFKSGWEVYEFSFDATQLDKLAEFRDWMNVTPQANRTRVEIEASRRKLSLKMIQLNPTLDGYPTGPVRVAALALKNGQVSDPILYGKSVLLVRCIGEQSNPAPTNPAPTNPAPTNPAPTNPAPTAREPKTTATQELMFQIMRFRAKPGSPDPSAWGQANTEAIQKHLVEHPRATPRELGQKFNEMHAGFASASVTDGITVDQIKEQSLRETAQVLKPGKTFIVFLKGGMVLIRHATQDGSQSNRTATFQPDAASPSDRFNRSAAPAASLLRDMTPEQTKLITQFIAAQSPTLNNDERDRTREWFRREWAAKGFEMTPAIEWLLQHDHTRKDSKAVVLAALLAMQKSKESADRLAREVEAAKVKLDEQLKKLAFMKNQWKEQKSPSTLEIPGRGTLAVWDLSGVPKSESFRQQELKVKLAELEYERAKLRRELSQPAANPKPVPRN